MSALFFSILAGSLAGLGMAEYAVHRRALSKIPCRIHVSGTRGKSSVTRLIAAGLRGGNIRCAAKTTGTLARMILPNGEEVPVFRPSGPNIIEQFRIVSSACRMKVDALVIECMALQPELHWVSENKLVRATHGVITNVRSDHLDIMGPTTADVAKAIAGMIPVNGKLYTAEHKYIDILRTVAKDRNTEIIEVGEDEIAKISKDELDGFSYTEHAENLALALRVIKDFGIDRDTALKSMQEAKPDPGVLTEHEIDFFGRRLIFINAFAANDPESTEKIWNQSIKKYKDVKRRIAILNLREDRPARTVQLAKDTSFWRSADAVILMGTGTYLFARLAETEDFSAGKFVHMEKEHTEDIFESIIELCGSSAIIVGVGNIAGQGLALTRLFKNREMFKGDVKKC